MKRTRLELEEGSRRKFWVVWTEGATMTARFGGLGTDGQSKPKTLASSAGAEAAATKLLEEKKRKGDSAAGAKSTATPATAKVAPKNAPKAPSEYHVAMIRTARAPGSRPRRR